jgi:hypothetical protein
MLLSDGAAEYNWRRMTGHRVQLRLTEEAMDRAQRVAAANGIRRISKLCERLLDLEGDRLGIDRGAPGLEVESNEEEEHRIQIRVPEGLWASVQPMVIAKGFKTISEMCREWLTRELRQFETEGGGAERGKSKKKRKKNSARRK